MDIYAVRCDRLAQLLRENYDGNKSALAERLNIQSSYLSRLYAPAPKNRRKLGDQLARRIERVSGKPPGWLDERNPVLAINETVADYQIVEPASLDILSRVPIVGNTQAGPDRHWVEEGFPAGNAEEYIDTPSRDPASYGLRIRGKSMWPRLREGDVLSISPAAECAAGDEVVVKTRGGEVMVKQLVASRINEVVLDSVNNEHPRIALAVEDIQLMHKVTAIVPGSMIVTA